jgi:hypothetical protein
MEKKMRTLMIASLVIVLLTACGAASGATTSGFPGGPGQFTPNPQMMTQIAADGGPGVGPAFAQVATTPTPTQTPLPTSTPQPTSTTVSQTGLAEQTVQNYFTALQNADFASASKLVSAFSLMTFKMTASDVVADLTEQKQAGATWSGLQILDSQVFNAQTVLVHVKYQLTSKDAKTGETVTTDMDELWPIRYENHQWLYNWNNLIDFNTLGFDTQTASGLSVTPLQVTRYTDRITLTLLVQNQTNQTIVIGSSNQTLATFYFGGKAVNADNTRYILEPLRSTSDVVVTVKGLYTSYPDSVELVKYNNSQTAPMFTFGLVD